MRCIVRNGVMPKGKVFLPPSKSEVIRRALLLGLCGEDPRKALAGYEGTPVCRDTAFALEASSHLAGEVCAGESAALLRLALPVKLIMGGGDITGEENVLRRGIWEYEECFARCFARRRERISLGDTRGIFQNKTRFVIDCGRSSQFLSGLLIALPTLDRECEIIIKNGLVSRPYADMTLRIVREFGGIIEETETGYRTYPSKYRAPENARAAGDTSYAAVFKAMNAMGGRVELCGADEDTTRPDAVFPDPAAISECDITDCPDLLPVLAAAACGKSGDTVIRGTSRLRTKESDREKETVRLIRALGGEAHIMGDRILVRGKGGLSGGEYRAANDHRMVFAAAAAALISEKPVEIIGAECVEKSAPAFFEDIKKLGMEITEVCY
ncbi:MAG: hypothetical protein K6G56_05885 [Clostridiales bacterium]|nr:hypothetical protein [Clostridiales bacterium]